LPEETFYAINPLDFYFYSNPYYYEIVKEKVKNSYVAHVYDSIYNSADFKHLNMFREGGFLWNLEKQYLEEMKG
jgi:hypothetical protein